MALLAANAGTQSKIKNAQITQTYNTSPKSVNIGAGASYNLENTKYKLNAAVGVRFRFDRPFSMANSELIHDVKLAGTFYSIIFATVPQIDHSTISIEKYGSILLDNGDANITNSVIKTDGIHNPKGGKPFPTKLLGNVAYTASFTFTEDPDLGRIAFVDSNGNSYEYGLPVKHGVDVSKEIPLPKSVLTFKSEDGAHVKTITVLSGTSLEKLNKKVFADKVLIDKGLVAELESEIEGTDDLDFEMFIDGDPNKPYSYSDITKGDTTIILKEVVGTRYYVNDGSDNAEHFVFVKGNDTNKVPLSIDEIIAKDSGFGPRGKTFKGWYLDKEGTRAATEIDLSVNTKLYAKWEDKRAFNVTYHRNTPGGQKEIDPSTVTVTLYEGEHLAGIMVGPNEDTHLISSAEAGYNLTGKGYYQSAFPRNTWYPWNAIGEYGIVNVLLDNFTKLYRTQAWNTQADGSGTYYRGGHTLTAKDFEATGGNIVLYNQWIELEKLKKKDAVAIADPNRARPEIKLSGEDAPVPGDYETAGGALVVDHSQTLNYYAYLNFDKIRSELVTLWGRINEVTQWYGRMEAYFDARLDFDKNIQILFESTWQVPDMEKLAEYGVVDVRQVEGEPTKWVFTIDKDKLMAEKITGRVGTDGAYDSTGYSFYKASLPVKIIPKYDPNGGADFQKLSFEDFMKPMKLTVYDNEDRGINAYITKESANKIALSDKPIMIVGGDIQMNINGFERQGYQILKYQLKSNAYDEHVKLYPSGKVHARYELVEHDHYDNVIEALKNPVNGNLTDSFEGRARNEKINTEDLNNYSESYDIAVPEYKTDTQNYDLVAIKVQVQETDENGDWKVDEAGNPLITEKVFSDRFYTVKAGSLEEGRKLLAGEFSHSQVITYVLQYAEPTIDIAVTKAWADKDGKHMAAPIDSVTVELYVDGTKADRALELNASNHWSGKFEMLKLKKADGTAYIYTVKEQGIDNNGEIQLGGKWYKATIEGDMPLGFTITNREKKPPIPDKPVEPQKPDKPVEPQKPDKPVGPQKPDKPMEPQKTNKPVEPQKPDQSNTTESTSNQTSPRTGEENHILLYLIFASTAVTLLVVLGIRKKTYTN